MEKRPKKLVAAPSHHGPGLGSRKYSEKDIMGPRASQIKQRISSYDSEVAEEESATDFTKNELLVFKTSMAKLRFANTYRMEPYRKFEAHVVRKKAEEILKRKLRDYKYSGASAAPMCISVTEDLLTAVKDQGFDRYKYIVQVFIVEKSGQSIHIASRWVWDTSRDNWVSAQHETENYISVALIIACYYE